MKTTFKTDPHLPEKFTPIFVPAALESEYRKFVILVRHFLLRMFHNDIMKFENQRRESIILMMTFLVAAGGIVSGIILMPYLRVIPGFTSETVWLEKTFFLAICMAFTGIISVINWDNMFLDEKDYLYLSALPVKTNTLYTAKFFSLLVFVALISLAVHMLAVFVFTFFLGEMFNIDPFGAISSLQLGAVHLLTGFLANLFVFLLVASIQSILMLLLDASRFKKVSIVVQTLLIMAFVSVFIWFPQMLNSLPVMKERLDTFVYHFPPMWFAGFYEQLTGNYDQLFKEFFYIAPIAVTLLLDLYVLSIPLSFRKFAHPTPGKRVAGRAPGLRRRVKTLLEKKLLDNPIQKAIFYFSLNTLQRSRKHKLQLTIYSTLPLAFGVTETVYLWMSKGAVYFQEPRSFLLAVPLVFYLFIAVGFRVAVTHPVCADANWIFRVAEGDYPTHYMRGMKKAFLVVGVLPYFIFFTALYWFWWGPVNALLHSLFCAATAFLLIEVLFINYKKLPFASAYVPGKFRVKNVWPLYLVVAALYVYLFTWVGEFMLEYPVAYLFFYSAVATDLYWLRWFRYKRNRGFRFVFDEEPEPAMMGLGFDLQV